MEPQGILLIIKSLVTCTISFQSDTAVSFSARTASHFYYLSEVRKVAMKFHNSTHEERLSATVSLCFLYCTGVISCGLVLILTFRERLYQTRVNLFLANIAFAQFLSNSTSLLLQPWNIMSDQKNFLCDWCGYIIYVTGNIAGWLVPFVALNRYMSIYHSAAFQRVFTTKNVIFIIIGGWIWGIGIMTPFHWGGITGFEHNYLNCGINTTDAKPFWDILLSVLLIVPSTIGQSTTGYCNFRIYMKFRDHAKNNSQILNHNVMSQNKQLMYLTLLHTIYSTCLQTPYLFGMFIPSMVQDNPLRWIIPCVYVLNSTMDPLTTLYVIKPYRKALINLFRCGNGNAVAPQASLVVPTIVVKRVMIDGHSEQPHRLKE